MAYHAPSPVMPVVVYLHVQAEQIPRGEKALLLFIDADQLSAAILEARHDGRIRRLAPLKPGPDGLLPVISMLIGKGGAERLLVVLEEGAYWPDCFPALDTAPLALTRDCFLPLQQM